MYNNLKQLVKILVPNRILFRYEPEFRNVLYQFYKGNTCQCNVCGKKLRDFIQSADGEKICPYCGSLPRIRRLWEILISGLLRDDMIILDFSPARCIYRILKVNSRIQYYATDISGDFLADYRYDITKLEIQDNKFDLIICYHILEHIVNDSQAMRELFRVLKPGCTCLIQTPFKEGDTYENSAVKSDDDRLKHFGQKDHVRIYSANGLKERLISCGFQVIIKTFVDLPDNRFGFKSKEEILICTK